jgi:two-component system, NtrC family, sensor kinase
VRPRGDVSEGRGAAAVLGALAARVTRRNAATLAFALALVCGLLDYATGIDLAFTVLYLAPIALATWFRGRRLGIAVAVICVAFAVMTEVSTRLIHHWRFHPLHMLWNHGGALAAFVVAVRLLEKLRTYVEAEERQRRLAVEQLRHAERLNVIGKLAAGVAHELGTPLGMVLGCAELVDLDEAASPKTHTLARKIVDQVNAMSFIIRQLLDFGRKRTPTATSTDLDALVEDGLALLEPLARKHGVRLVTERAVEPVVVRANDVEMGQVLNNIVLNAIQATPAGGEVRVRCEVRPARASGNHKVAAMTVADTGTGIPTEALPHIFDPFFTTKDVGGGAGLGLSVTYGIVQDVGGRIEVESHAGEGSTFTVFLPLG